ncbi:hypothetical protein AtDm6_0784 [Acetobacter tropicalis]|uniref:Uncharacterized protein n=1 Tax=Acetobacter tropicalis TaxID=104102 RepID=A0A095B8J7_9PROT|nr:hypothetical protein AtDm6_0784 [Acetobacter tropicalis]
MMSGQPTEHFEKNMVSKPAMHEAQFTTAQFPKEWGGFFCNTNDRSAGESKII